MSLTLKLWRFLSSRRVAIVLLFAVTFMLLIGSVLPNPNFMSKQELERFKRERPVVYFLSSRFNTQSIAKGYIFGFIGVFLIISTTACSIDRLIERRRLKRIPLSNLPLKEFDFEVTLEDKDAFLKKLKKTLRLKRWFLREEQNNDRYILLAEKGIFGFWGSVFFHGILITLLFGLVLYYFNGFYATILFTEGQSRVLKEDTLDVVYRKPILGVKLPPLELKLEHFIPVYWNDREPIDYMARFLIKEPNKNKTWEQIFKINRPFRYGGIDFLMVLYGYSPNFIVYDREGRKLYDSYIALSVVGGQEDSFDINELGLRFRCILFPDFMIDEKGYYTTKSPLPRNPVFLIKVIDRMNKVLYAGLIRLGEEKNVGPYKIRFADLRYWITLNLVRETGIGFFFWCGLLGIVGLLVRFIDPDRKIYLIYREGNLSVVSFSKHFGGILKEQTKDMVKGIIKKGGV
jgi:cytochrome c biogenesis protein ResB